MQVNVPTPPPGTTQYVAAVLAPPRGPSSSVAVELAVPANGTGYLSDNDPGAQLVISWTSGTPLRLCGLAGAMSHQWTWSSERWKCEPKYARLLAPRPQRGRGRGCWAARRRSRASWAGLLFPAQLDPEISPQRGWRLRDRVG